jgi:uncharacterized membrane protein
MEPWAKFFIILLLLGGSAAAQSATLQGYVRDGNSGESIPNVLVDVYASEDHVKPVASTQTDEKGFYAISVPSGRYYDVYLRTGEVNPNQRTPQTVSDRGVYTLNFNIVAESIYGTSVIDRYGVAAVVILAFVLFIIIVYDQLVARRTRKPDVAALKRERDEVQGMINLSRDKYHRREIDEESFRSITKDQQEKLIEIESKIGKIDGKPN